MIGFWRALVGVEIARRKHKVLKEIVIGLVAGAILVTLLWSSPDWALLLFSLYLFIVQASTLMGNDFFMAWSAWHNLGFRRPSLTYRVSYIADYVLRDFWIAELCATVVVVAGSIAWGFPVVGMAVVAMQIGNLWLLPSHDYLVSRITQKARDAYGVTLVVVIGVFAFALVFGYRLPFLDSIWFPVISLAVFVCYAFGVDFVAQRLRPVGFEPHNGRGMFAWVLPRSPILFKDILLSWTGAASQLSLTAALVFVLSMINGWQAAPIVAFFFLVMNNIFLHRRRQTERTRLSPFKLIADDQLFSDDIIPKDKGLLRRGKLHLVAWGCCISLIVCLVLVFLFGTGGLNQVWPTLCALVVGFVLDAAVLYSTTLVRRLSIVVKYLMVVLAVAVVYAPPYAPGLWVFCAVLIALYVPFIVRVYWVEPTSLRRTG